MRQPELDRGLRIVVVGYLVRAALAGHAWHHLHYVAGLERLGHDVWFLEYGDESACCYDPELDSMVTDPACGLAFAEAAFAAAGLDASWAYHDAHERRWLGPGAAGAESAIERADAVVNLSGAAALAGPLEAVPLRILVDTDPAFTQAAHLADPDVAERARAHTAFFTFAENVGSGAELPDDGLPWKPTRQPVVLDLWPPRPAPGDGAYTTVMLWDSYPAAAGNGTRLGLKSDSFEPYVDLPGRVRATLELALGGAAPRAELAENGWRLRDPRGPSMSLETYQGYIGGSRGEFSVAKHGYVTTNSGWFSERSANYLASGRPVVAQDTGFSDVLPVGEGLLAFHTPDEAVACLEEVEGDHERHSRAARALVEEHFDSQKVLAKLLAEAASDA
jgi:hypothetical protein